MSCRPASTRTTRDTLPNSRAEDILVRPFAALRPQPRYAAEVAAPPYDVMSSAEARTMAAGKARSFLHVSRAEIDLPPATDPYSPAVYAGAAAKLAALEADGVLVRDRAPAYYAYRISNGAHSQTGIGLAASIAAYNQGRIRRHELTRPAKETDRVRQIEAVGALTGPVMLVHRNAPQLDELLATAIDAAPALLQAEVDGWRHDIWPLTESTQIARISALLNGMDTLYIADGHHRSAAAARVAANGSRATPADAFLAVSFAAEAVTILDYNRVVSDLNGATPASFLAALESHFEIRAAAAAVRPDEQYCYGLYLDGQWHRLRLRQAPDAADVVATLDVSVLDQRVLAPLLGIDDPRTNPRIDFIGGSRGPQAVAARVDAGTAAVGFTLFPTRIEDLMAVADAGRIMPPKSTWFEPKLADGLLSLPLP